MSEPTIGRSVPRKEARDKVMGRARYVDDVASISATSPMLHGVTVRSTCPRGRIKAIHFDPRIPWSEIVVVTAKDLPAVNCIALINDDQPCLADAIINHPEEAVVLLAHANKVLLEQARDAIRIEVVPLPAVLTLEAALAKEHVIWGTDNVFKEYTIRKGDSAAAFARADFVVEGEYETGAQEQLYIENNGMIAVYDANDGVTVWGSLQCPYYIQKALMKLFDVPAEKARVVQMETGGGFGGKEEFPSMIAAHAALLARKAGKPVKIIYDRGEDMAATTKRHPSRTRHRTAVAKDGAILAMEIDFVIDGGAYSTLSQVVLSRGCIHAAGPYDVANIDIRARAVATNSPPHGAFRGFGAPQSIFALERHMDAIARRLGTDPIALRKKNFVKPGQTLATGQRVRDPIDMSALLDSALAASGYHEKRARFAKENAKDAPIKRGMGIASFMHGTGFTGSGEKYLASIVGMEGTAEGNVRVLAASTEIGQGTNTIFAQIAADALGVDYDLVVVAQPDTSKVPNSGPTVASRTCTIVGKLVENAAIALKQILLSSGMLKAPYTTEEFSVACARYVRELGALRTKSQYEQPPHIKWDEVTFVGDAYGAYSWAVYVAEVSVDLRTYQATVDDFVALQEVGKVIHPLLAAGQIEGGVAQGIGWALYEQVVWKDGRMANNRMTDYIMPTSVDLPPIRVVFDESIVAASPLSNVDYAAAEPQTCRQMGPAGAKGIGELPMDGPAPAILNAIEDAIGVSIRRVPATPEIVMEACES